MHQSKKSVAKANRSINTFAMEQFVGTAVRHLTEIETVARFLVMSVKCVIWRHVHKACHLSERLLSVRIGPGMTITCFRRWGRSFPECDKCEPIARNRNSSWRMICSLWETTFNTSHLLNLHEMEFHDDVFLPLIVIIAKATVLNEYPSAFSCSMQSVVYLLLPQTPKEVYGLIEVQEKSCLFLLHLSSVSARLN